MNIHEYQAKHLLVKYGIQIPQGCIAHSPDEVVQCASEMGGERWVVKAQVHSGARGKAGGIKVCSNEAELLAAAEALFGKVLVTHQTGAQGKMISRLYVEQASNIETELYLGVVFDRASERVMLIATAEGGMDIEEVAEKNPDAIKRLSVEPAVGLQAFQARALAFELGLDAALIGQAAKTIIGVYRAFRDLDCNMFEINPLVVTKDKHLLALDAKMGFDENALFRQTKIAELRDPSQEDPRETAAADQGLSYVGLEGEIGCMINGAGLAMATMDMIKHVGGEPANFLDIGGGASPERVGKALDLVLADKSVKAILVNIFAGINRCDWVAQGVVDLLNSRPVDVPLVVRLSGTNVEAGQKILRDSGTNIITADTLEEAAKKVVAASKAAA